MIEMKIGASTLFGFGNKLENTLETIEELGIEYAELVHQYPDEEINSDMLESFNLKYTIHAPFMDVNIAAPGKSSRRNSISQVKNSIDLANEINAEAVVVHPGLMAFLLRETPEKVYKTADSSIEKLAKYSADLGVNTTIENMPDFEAMIYKDLTHLNETVEKYGLAMTLDIGHANHVGISPDAMYFDSIKHIHIHDNLGDEDSHLALGEGSIQLNYIVNNFESKNYDGIYIIEVNNEDSVKKSLKYLKNNF